MAKIQRSTKSLCAWVSILLASVSGAQESGGPTHVPTGLSPGDWSAIRSVHELERYKAVGTELGFEARNPGQGWLTRFDGRSFLVTPDRSAWEWGLQLEAYGFEGSMLPVSVAACASADGGRVTYDWDSNLQEWYVNDERGLEHGYTIQSRPARGADPLSPLTFALSLRGTLHAEILPDRKGVRFVDPAGETILTYSGLKVFGAMGTELSTWFEVVGGQLRILIRESDATYPLTIDPIAQQAHLVASNADPNDWFGYSVDISGDLMIVGAYREQSSSSGVNGDETDNSLSSGAAYLFERVGGVWTQMAYLKASNPGGGDRFGASVSIDGELVAVGAWKEDSDASGIDGDQNNDNAQDSGAVYLFSRHAGVWSQEAYLKASNTGADDAFGSRVLVSGNRVVVSASQESSNATGVNGDQSNDDFRDSGAVYIFERVGGVWSQQAYLKASNTDPGDYFGAGTAIFGDTLVVGAPREDSHATGVNGVQDSALAPSSGAAYVFVQSGGVWGQ